ncbi:MAG: hypothetical protein WCC04_20715 [Terriglobales bacterium]
MANLSDDQLISIAQQFHDLAVAVSQFRLEQIHGGASLDDQEIVQLLGLQYNLFNTSSSFYLQAAKITLVDADQAAAQVMGATKDATAAIKTLKVINKAISIGSAVGVLAAAVMTGDMSQIGNAAKGVYTAINSQ